MEVEKKKVIDQKMVKIMPLKDHVVKQNKFYYEIKQGVEISVAEQFIAALKTEKVIN